MPQPREQYFEVVEDGRVIGMANQEPGGWWQALYGKHERLGSFHRPMEARAAILSRHGRATAAAAPAHVTARDVT